jgi:hypothetical protein
MYIWLVVWNMIFLTFHILGIRWTTDFHIFQRGWNHQPDIYIYIAEKKWYFKFRNVWAIWYIEIKDMWCYVVVPKIDLWVPSVEATVVFLTSPLNDITHGDIPTRHVHGSNHHVYCRHLMFLAQMILLFFADSSMFFSIHWNFHIDHHPSYWNLHRLFYIHMDYDGL